MQVMQLDRLPGEAHAMQELLFAAHGNCTVSIDGLCHLLQEGEILFFRPNSFRAVRTDGQLVRLIFVSDSPALDILNGHIFPGEPSLLNKLLDEIDRKEPGWEQLTVNILELMIVLCLRHGGTECRERAVSAHAPQHDWIVYQVRSYLHNYYDRRITLDLLAAEFDISTSLLKRIFKAHTGRTVITYLTDLRIAKAKELIRAGTHTFTQIATLVGYENIYYFSYQFKKQTGMSPTEFSLRKDVQ